MKIGLVILPDARWAEAKQRWVRAEALGFDHAWTYDHLSWRCLRDGPWFGALPTLVAAAAATTTLRLGTLVASPNFRHPVPFAKELMSLDDISLGRLTVGLGAGGDGFDATAMGQQAWTPKIRADHFDEFVPLLDQLLCRPKLTHNGEIYTAVEVRGMPGTIQQPRPPFAIAGGGPRGMALAARHGDYWIAIDDRDTNREKQNKMSDICTKLGRDPATLKRLALVGFRERPMDSIESFRDVVGRYGEMGFTDLVVHWPRASEPFAASDAVLDEIAAELPALRS